MPEPIAAPNHYFPWQGLRCTGGHPHWPLVHRNVRGKIGALPVIPKECGVCTQQTIGKPASLYWAWTRADNRRKAWKQKVCLECFREHYAALIVRSMEPVLICPSCGIGTADDYDAVYLTYCMPGMPKDQSEMPLCPACAVKVRNLALSGAVELEDREVGVGGPQPDAITAAQTWASLGIVPR